MEEKIIAVINDMAEVLNASQLKKLQESLLNNFSDNCFEKSDISNKEYLALFLSAKKIEGCSVRTVKYYQETINAFFTKVDCQIRKISTELIREYLVRYQSGNGCSRVTVDNTRRNI